MALIYAETTGFANPNQGVSLATQRGCAHGVVGTIHSASVAQHLRQNMRVNVVYLAGSRAQAGCEREAFDVPTTATLANVISAVVAQHPALAPLIGSVRWARNHAFVDVAERLREGDEVALLPPVSGGAPRAEIREDPLDPRATSERVQGPGVGATVLFLGTVRDHSEGRSVRGVTYEAYRPMAERELEQVAAGLSDPAAAVSVAISHRVGALAVGELAVVIAAAAPHRAAAFETCRAAIERIKKDVPIWKCESFDDGDTWTGWSGG